MATRRRIGVSIASTEAARRQLMQPVPCWEKVWVNSSAGSSTLKVYKWVKTEKVQQFDDEEGEADEPLAPLPDEPEVVDGDEDEQEDVRNEPIPKHKDMDMDDRPSEVPPSPKPQLTLTQPNSELDVTANDDGGLNNGPPLNLDADMGGGNLDEDKGLQLDISVLGPDGLSLEGAHDLSQLATEDVLLGGPLMDATTDPFVAPST